MRRVAFSKKYAFEHLNIYEAHSHKKLYLQQSSYTTVLRQCNYRRASQRNIVQQFFHKLVVKTIWLIQLERDWKHLNAHLKKKGDKVGYKNEWNETFLSVFL